MKRSTKISLDFKDGVLRAKAEKDGEIVYQSDDVISEFAEAISSVFDELETTHKRFTGRMICIDNKDLTYYTKGKIYEVVDGEYLDDTGEELIMTTDSPEKETDAIFMTVID